MTDQKRTEDETAGADTPEQESTEATETKTATEVGSDIEDAEFEEIGTTREGEEAPEEGSEASLAEESDTAATEAETGEAEPEESDAEPEATQTDVDGQEGTGPADTVSDELTSEEAGADDAVTEGGIADAKAEPAEALDSGAAPWSDEWSSSSVATPAPDDAGNATAEEAPVAESPEEIDTSGSSSVAPAAVAAAAAEPTREVVRETVVEKQGGIVPGLIAGLIGGIAVVFGAPYVVPRGWLPPPDTTAIDAQIGELRSSVESAEATAAAVADLASAQETLATKEDLEAVTATLGTVRETQTGLISDIEGVTSAVADISGEADALSGQLAEVSGQVGDLVSRVDELTPRLEALGPRIDELERRPIAESPDPTAVAAVQSYGREVEALRAEYSQNVEDLRATYTGEVDALEAKYTEDVAALRSEYDSKVSALQTDVNAQMEQADDILQEAVRQSTAAREEAAALAEQAAARTRLAAEQQALADVQAALTSGEPFAEALAVFDGSAPTQGLAEVAESGVDTLAQLQAEFPPLAREALGRAREDLSGNSASERGMAFLQRQLGVRSLAPREGDSADAVLSRAEAAVREARLTDAVAELEALPDTAKGVMQDWIARASARATALAAANDLAAGLTPN